MKLYLAELRLCTTHYGGLITHSDTTRLVWAESEGEVFEIVSSAVAKNDPPYQTIEIENWNIFEALGKCPPLERIL